MIPALAYGINQVLDSSIELIDIKAFKYNTFQCIILKPENEKREKFSHFNIHVLHNKYMTY